MLFRSDADGRAGVLTGRQLALGRNDLIQQHGVGHELVVVGSFGIFEDVAQFLQVRGAQKGKGIENGSACYSNDGKSVVGTKCFVHDRKYCGSAK